MLRTADDPQPAVRVAVAPPFAVQTSNVSPALHVDLSTLGYSHLQQEKLKPQVRSIVAQHHQALVGHGFTHAHIVELSKHPPALGSVAAKYPDIIATLPEATHEDIVSVGKQWSGARALDALLRFAAALREPPLQLVTGQLLKIATRGGVKAVEAVHAWRHTLTAHPLHLKPVHVVAIASHDGGRQALETVQRLLPALCQDHGLTLQQVVAIASNHGGRQALETVHRLLPSLCNDNGLTPDQVVAIASNVGGKQALETVQRLLPGLCEDHGLHPDQVVSIARHDGGRQALETVQRLLPGLCKDHGLRPDQVVSIAGHDGGKQALETVQCLLPGLCKDHGLTSDQVVAIASNRGGKQALEAVQRLLPALCKGQYLIPAQVVAIASNDGGKQALEAVQRLLPILCEEHGLTTEQVVAIASNIGGRQALETVQRLLPRLCKTHGLTPAQVVSIANNIGGRQALETVQRLLPVLCKTHGLTPAQVVAIASNGGGKQALETVQRLLPRLCNEHGLTKNQVVAIASNGGAKQALDAVQRLLPVLCNDHGLTPHQVIAIASNGGGRQAVESVLAQLSRPDPVLAELSNDRLVALACLGGRPALDAVIKGLPHAPMLIRRANRRIPERTAHPVADAAQVVQVLSFFQCHVQPACAFDEAMQQFGMSMLGLLQLFRRVGVTELEARSGMLPPASQRWQRIVQALGGQPSSAPTPNSPQESGHAFAEAPERELAAPSLTHQVDLAPTSSHRKRSRSKGSAHRSQQRPAQARLSEQPDAVDAHLPNDWGRKRLRSKIGSGLPDPGMPTDADLEACNTLFVGQDAALLAGAEENFPAFNDEEMAWVMTLLPS